MFIILEICEERLEWKFYSYFRLRIERWEISIHKTGSGIFQFNIDLPLFHLTNTDYRHVSKGIGSYCHLTAQVSGKILFWSIRPKMDGKI